MKILYSKLTDLPVETKNKKLLGKVVDLEVDIDTYCVAKIHVKSDNIIKGLFEDVLIIDQSQIINITSKKIIVVDNIKKDKAKKRLNIKLADNKETVAVTSAERE